MIDVKNEKREEVIDRNESDENKAFFISSMIDCMINVKDEKKEEVINKETWKSEEDKDENDITKELSIIAETFWSSCIAKRVRAFWVWVTKADCKMLNFLTCFCKSWIVFFWCITQHKKSSIWISYSIINSCISL